MPAATSNGSCQGVFIGNDGQVQVLDLKKTKTRDTYRRQIQGSSSLARLVKIITSPFKRQILKALKQEMHVRLEQLQTRVDLALYQAIYKEYQKNWLI